MNLIQAPSEHQTEVAFLFPSPNRRGQRGQCNRMTGRKGAKVRRNAAIVRVRKPDPLTECQSGIERPGPSPVWIGEQRNNPETKEDL